jgi:hypothetical protein
MPRQLYVDTVGVQAMVGRWDASATELTENVAPNGFGLSCQPSAAAVKAAHADVTAFTAALATRVSIRAAHVTDADTRYITNEADSARELAAVTGV